MKRFLSIALVTLSLATAYLPALAQPAGDLTLTLTVNGQQRTAYVHAPASIEPSHHYPLVIGYHGGAGNAEGYIRQSGIFAKGEQAGFIVVCPQGTALFAGGNHRVWNSGREYAQASRNADDVAFSSALIDEIAARYPIDQKRVYATGFSNGAQMSYRLALELGNKIAAIAPMSGGRLAGGSQPSRPLPILHFHGTADSVYPLEGGLGPHSIGRTPHVPIPAVMLEWSKFNGAHLVAQQLNHPGWAALRHDGPVPVELILVKGMGHQIAGGADNHLPDQAMRNEPDATTLALQFFSAHPMP